MAPVTTEKKEKPMATDAIVSGAGEGGREKPQPPQQQPSRRADDRPGFFHLYKPGQGYWTRMGTAGAALLITLLTAHFLYQNLPTWLMNLGVSQGAAKPTSIYIIAGLAIAFGLFVWYMMNKPGNADFLIATDSEMKKVNWTSRRELIGSTKVVIIFMFLIAFLLFAFDIIFGYLFYFLDVLKTKPF
jgi:preprotein translocase subunit SecE